MLSSPLAPSDDELARLARSGCAASFEQLVRRFQAPVLQFLRRRGAGADAEDLVQETFVRVWANLDRYEPSRRFASWLFTIARRLHINHGRRAPLRLDGEALQRAASPEPGPAESAADSEGRKQLWDLAAQVLSEPEWTATWLYYVEDMPVRDIAAVLDRSWIAVKTMLYRARRRLLPRLESLRREELADDAKTSSWQEPCRELQVGAHHE